MAEAAGYLYPLCGVLAMWPLGPKGWYLLAGVLACFPDRFLAEFCLVLLACLPSCLLAWLLESFAFLPGILISCLLACVLERFLVW